ncbi:MAG: hypothetical protein WBP29_06060 [Candidatus Zixiibacteriota bacterium]
MSQTDTQTINIDARERRKRRRVSIIATIITVLMFAALQLSESGQNWYLLLFVPSWVAVLGLLQVKSQVCVVFAARGVRNLGSGVEDISDPAQVRILRTIALGIYIRSLMIALAFTVIVYSLMA